MGLIVAAAASIGFLSSVALLWLGVHAMWLRYVLAACVGYGFFVGLVWLWLPARRRRFSGGADRCDVADVADVADLVDLGGALVDAIPPRTGQTAARLPAEAEAPFGDVSGLDADLGLDELVVLVAVVAAVVAGFAAACYVVIGAPSFFAEVLVDGAISYGLYRRVPGLERRHWVRSSVSRTLVPFAVVVVFLAVAGVAMQWYAPGADSIGDVWSAR
jgi:hypothetical protein